MGMFDYLRIEYPLPDEPPDWVKKHAAEFEFQTKDTPAQFMERYTITTDGRLVHHQVRYEHVPESDRPYFGTEEWEKDLLWRLVGSVQEIPMGDVELSDFHADLECYAGTMVGDQYESYRYVARFSSGKLEWIKRAD